MGDRQNRVERGYPELSQRVSVEAATANGGIMTRCLASMLLLLVSSTFLLADMEPGAGNCDLFIRVISGDQKRIETPVQVALLGPQGAIATTQIVGDEAAVFKVANGKTYRVTVSGLGIETVSSSYFSINALEPSHTETVQVKYTQNTSDKSTPSSATISLSDLKVPKKASAEMKKGLEAYSKGEHEKAAAHFEKAIVEYPQYARAYDMLGAIAIKRPDRSKAREMFSKAIQADGTFIPGYVDLARMDVQDQDYAASESLLVKAVSINPSAPDALSLLASTEFANKEYDKALADVERTHALANHQQFAEVHLMAGKVLRMQNHPEAAIAQFQLFLQEKPDSPESDSVRKAIAALQAAR